MKKFALAFMFACSCFLSLFSINTSATISTNQPQALPYTINSTAYTDVVVYYQDWLDRTIWFYYNPVYTSGYGGQLRFTGSGISDGGSTGTYAVYCQQYGDNTGTLYCDPSTLISQQKTIRQSSQKELCHFYYKSNIRKVYLASKDI